MLVSTAALIKGFSGLDQLNLVEAMRDQDGGPQGSERTRQLHRTPTVVEKQAPRALASCTPMCATLRALPCTKISSGADLLSERARKSESLPPSVQSTTECRPEAGVLPEPFQRMLQTNHLITDFRHLIDRCGRYSAAESSRVKVATGCGGGRGPARACGVRARSSLRDRRAAGAGTHAVAFSWPGGLGGKSMNSLILQGGELRGARAGAR
jgi:hypothetical protein